MPEQFDYYFLVLAPGLQSAWFFQAARRYWQRYQPIVTDANQLDLLDYIPANSRVAVTLLARPDTADYARQQILARRSDAHVDPIVTNDLPSMEVILTQRAESGRRLGYA